MRRSGSDKSFEHLSFDPFPLFQSGFVTAGANDGRCDVVAAFVVPLVIIIGDASRDLGVEVTEQDIVFNTDKMTFARNLKLRKTETSKNFENISPVNCTYKVQEF